jgi:hypothetical protein
MLIPHHIIYSILKEYSIHPTGVLHIGAHDCEELPFYTTLGIHTDSMIWIDAVDAKINQGIQRGIPNLYNALITDKDDTDIEFNISNNVQSSSILEFGTHSIEHSYVVYVDKVIKKSITIDTFFKRNNLNAKKYTIWNLDIQGAELLALKGGIESLQYAKMLYLEVNEKELYKGCALVDELDAFLSTYKFKRVHTHMTHHGWGDAIYVLTS